MENKQDSILAAAKLLKSIGHPIRVKIIIALSQNGSMTVTKISNYLSIHQPVISLHLAVLRKQNVITVKRDGKKSYYSIEDISVKQIVNIAYNSRKI